MYETGAGGSAPKHVQKFNDENHLRWDSLGEFLALAASFEHLAGCFNNPASKLLGETLDVATTRYLLENKTPSRKCGEPDNRTSHFHVAKFWARALADQNTNLELAELAGPIAAALESNEDAIVKELNDVQGKAMDVGGYYQPDPEKTARAMRPCNMLNEIIDSVTVAH